MGRVGQGACACACAAMRGGGERKMMSGAEEGGAAAITPATARVVMGRVGEKKQGGKRRIWSGGAAAWLAQDSGVDFGSTVVLVVVAVLAATAVAAAGAWCAMLVCESWAWYWLPSAGCGKEIEGMAVDRLHLFPRVTASQPVCICRHARTHTLTIGTHSPLRYGSVACLGVPRLGS